VTARSASRTRHLLPASLVLALAATVFWLSVTREPADAFLFPRLTGGIMLLLAAWNFARAALGLARTGDGLDRTTLGRVAPGVLVMLVLVLFAAKALGFYTASFVAFVVLYSLYDPAPHDSPVTWAKRLAIAAAFMLVVYLLFTLLLKVQIPRGALL